MTHSDAAGVALGAPWPISATTAGGQLLLAGTPVSELAERFGTPSFLLDEADLLGRARAFKAAFDDAFGAPVEVFYASKAFSSKAVLKLVHGEGLSVDCATEGELAVALAAGIAGEAIGLHGNNKSEREIRMAIGAGVGRVIVDSLAEIDLLERIATELDARVPVLIRVTTGVHAGGHEFIATAHEDQKFGLSLASGAARAAVDAVLASSRLDLLGLHSHIGSQILATEGFAEAATAVLGLRAELLAEGVDLPEIDLGGGYGIAYLPGEDDLDPRTVAEQIAQTVRETCAELGVSVPRISIEPGRAIVGPAMITVYEVGTIKTIDLDEGQRTYVSVDGGMSDNIRPVLYEAAYTARLANRTSTAPLRSCRIVGKHCESGDILIPEIDLPSDLAAGDLLVVAATGAYGRSLASNYNQVPRPGVVAVTAAGAREILRRETIEDLLRLDLG